MEKMNLQLFAGEMNTQTTGALSAEMKTYYGRPFVAANWLCTSWGLAFSSSSMP